LNPRERIPRSLPRGFFNLHVHNKLGTAPPHIELIPSHNNYIAEDLACEIRRRIDHYKKQGAILTFSGGLVLIQEHIENAFLIGIAKLASCSGILYIYFSKGSKLVK